MSTPGYLIQIEDHDGPLNMAIDEVLWNRAARGMPYLRLYGWADRPALSLGYFQDSEEVRRDPRLRDLPFVRRLTGGGAIVHDDELTYSLALPARLAGTTSDLYLRVHRAIAESMAELDIPATVGVGSGSNSPAEMLCFQRGDRFAVRVRGIKVLGSAQRRRPEAVLMHGSLLMSSSSAAPGMVGLREILGSVRSVESLRQALTAAVERAVGLDLRSTELPLDLRLEANLLADSKYRTSSWNDRQISAKPKSPHWMEQPA